MVNFVIWNVNISSRRLSWNLANLHVVDLSWENFEYALILNTSDNDPAKTKRNKFSISSCFSSCCCFDLADFECPQIWGEDNRSIIDFCHLCKLVCQTVLFKHFQWLQRKYFFLTAVQLTSGVADCRFLSELPVWENHLLVLYKFTDITKANDGTCRMAWFTHIIHLQTSKGIKIHFWLYHLDDFLRDFLASISLWRGAAWKQAAELLRSTPLFRLKRGFPVFISEGLHSWGSSSSSLPKQDRPCVQFLHPLRISSSLKKVLTLSVILLGRAVTFRFHPNGLGSYPLTALPLSSPCDVVDGTSGTKVTPVTISTISS